MNQSAYNKLVSFIWNTVYDCLHNVYVLGKYSVLFLMVIFRRLGTHLKPIKEANLDILILFVLQYSFANYIPFYAKIYNFKRDGGYREVQRRYQGQNPFYSTLDQIRL